MRIESDLRSATGGTTVIRESGLRTTDQAARLIRRAAAMFRHRDMPNDNDNGHRQLWAEADHSLSYFLQFPQQTFGRVGPLYPSTLGYSPSVAGEAKVKFFSRRAAVRSVRSPAS